MKFTQKITILMIYLFVFVFLIYNYFSLSLDFDKTNYLVLLASYLLCGFLFILTIFKRDYYIFEPYTLVSLLYIAIMIYRPCLDFATGNYYKFGVYFMSGCMKTTIIFTISFIAFTLSYNSKKTKR